MRPGGPVSTGGRDEMCPVSTGGRVEMCPVSARGRDEMCPVSTGGRDEMCPVSTGGRNEMRPVSTGGRDEMCPVSTGGRNEMRPVSTGGRRGDGEGGGRARSGTQRPPRSSISSSRMLSPKSRMAVSGAAPAEPAAGGAGAGGVGPSLAAGSTSTAPARNPCCIAAQTRPARRASSSVTCGHLD